MALWMGLGNIKGIIIGDKLRFDWRWSTAFGKGELKIVDDNKLEGTCGYDQSYTGAGVWKLE